MDPPYSEILTENVDLNFANKDTYNETSNLNIEVPTHIETQK